MPTFIMFGNYSAEAMKDMSADRTVWAFNLVKEMGGTVKDIYALLGQTDLIFIVELPGIAEAMKLSVALSKSTGIGFTTSPAVTVEEFDKLIS